MTANSAQPQPAPADLLRQLKIIGITFIGPSLALAAVAWVIFDSDGYPQTWVPWALGGFALLVAGYCLLVAPAVAKPLDPATPPDRRTEQALAAFRVAVFMRLAAASGLGIMSFLLAFILQPQSPWTPTIGAVLALILLLTVAQPNRQLAAALEKRLDARGAQSGLTRLLFGEDGPTGPAPSGSASGGIEMH